MWVWEQGLPQEKIPQFLITFLGWGMWCFLGLGAKFTSGKAPPVPNYSLRRGHVVFRGVRSHIYLRESSQIPIYSLGRLRHFVGLGAGFILGKAPLIPNCSPGSGACSILWGQEQGLPQGEPPPVLITAPGGGTQHFVGSGASFTSGRAPKFILVALGRGCVAFCGAGSGVSLRKSPPNS